jgi:hypothetical protein
MPSLLAVKTFLSSKWPYLAAGVVIIGACLLLAYCTGRSDGKSGEVIKAQDREIEVKTKVGDANENAAGTRVEDATKLQRQQQEIEDAVRNAKGPDDVRAKRGCVILQQQGRDTSAIPACR